MNSRDLGLFVGRAALGGTVAAHGFQKLFGMFGGGGIDATAAGFEKMGFDRPRESAIASGLCEGVGGSMLVLGAATPVAAAAVAGNLAVAATTHRPKGFFNSGGGLEFPATLSAVAAGFALTGPGNLSFDRILKHRYSKGWMGFVALAAAAAAAASIVQRREQKLAAGASSPAEEPPADRSVSQATASSPAA